MLYVESGIFCLSLRWAIQYPNQLHVSKYRFLETGVALLSSASDESRGAFTEHAHLDSGINMFYSIVFDPWGIVSGLDLRAGLAPALAAGAVCGSGGGRRPRSRRRRRNGQAAC